MATDLDKEVYRFLQDATSNTNNTNNTNNKNGDGESSDRNDLLVLRDTLLVYGGIFLIAFLIFCWLRKRFPKVYNARSWLDEWGTPLAHNQFGWISWTWKVFGFSNDTLMDECGMDAICSLRVLHFGFKISAFGMINAIWLIPVYATADSSEATESVDNFVESISVAHLPPGSNRFIATLIASYLIFGYTCWLILQEFDWFFVYRHRFLSKPLARNYSVYVQCIPEEYRSNAKLLNFFRDSISRDSVLDANILVKTPNLQDKVEEREKLLANLDHAINAKQIEGEAPTSRAVTIVGEEYNEIPKLYEDLHKLNSEITECITKIEQDDDAHPSPRNNAFTWGYGDNSINTEDKFASNSDGASEEGDGVMENVKDVASNPIGSVKGAMSSEDGERLSAAFISFKTWSATQIALQMLHYRRPFSMEIIEAPSPKDVTWSNTAKSHKEMLVGKLVSLSLTAVICLFWSIVMSFIASLSNVGSLRDQVGFIDSMLEVAPWLVPVFAQLAPLLILVAHVVLRKILHALSTLEGHISGAAIEASTFSKLAAFRIIQTFFIQALSSTVFEALDGIINDPIGEGIPLLAESLPGQSTYFIQILLVDTFIGLSLEILRVVDVALAGLRSCFASLTEKERRSKYLSPRPLAEPEDFKHANVLAGAVLYLMVLFVYAPIAPLVNFFLAFCFIIMNACYRNQFIYIYPVFPDSGGRLWLRFINIVPICIIIAEVTIIGMFGLKEAPIAAALMAPLIVATFIFKIYINKKHFETALYLPDHEAMAKDIANTRDMSFGFIQGEYIQPSLRNKELHPENDPHEREAHQGQMA